MFACKVALFGGVDLAGCGKLRFGCEKGAVLRQRVVENFPVFLWKRLKQSRKRA
jgi:hypothetical protein